MVLFDEDSSMDAIGNELHLSPATIVHLKNQGFNTLSDLKQINAPAVVGNLLPDLGEDHESLLAFLFPVRVDGDAPAQAHQQTPTVSNNIFVLSDVHTSNNENFPSFILSTESGFRTLDTVIKNQANSGLLQVVYKRNITLEYIHNSKPDEGSLDEHQLWKTPYNFSRTAGCTMRNMIVRLTHENGGNHVKLPELSDPAKTKNQNAWVLGNPQGKYHPIYEKHDHISKELRETHFFAQMDKILPHYEIEFRILRLRSVHQHQAYFKEEYYAISAAGNVIWYVVLGWDLSFRDKDQTPKNKEAYYTASPEIVFYILYQKDVQRDVVEIKPDPLFPHPPTLTRTKAGHSDTKEGFAALTGEMDTYMPVDAVLITPVANLHEAPQPALPTGYSYKQLKEFVRNKYTECPGMTRNDLIKWVGDTYGQTLSKSSISNYIVDLKKK